MAGIKDISSVWKNIKEIDLKPIRDAATQPIRIALVGMDGAGKHTLAEQMRTDPARPGIHAQTTLALIPIGAGVGMPVADLIIVIADATHTDFTEEQTLVKHWFEAGKNLLVLVNKIDLVSSNIVGDAQQGWAGSKVIYGSVNDIVWLEKEFIPTVLEHLPQLQIALGRQFPLFRMTIAHQLINEACLSNAAYSFSTGLAEIVPILDLPLNITDMVVLTKLQAFLAYKLGLLLGFSTRWQDYVSEFGSVIGSGFLWRQIARELVGLIPGWGIVPKVAVAYSGTYVVGNAILGWYLTGRNLSPKQMRALYLQAFTKGKEYAQKLGGKIPKIRFGKRRERLPMGVKDPKLVQGEIVISKEGNLSSQNKSQELVPAQGAENPGQGEIPAEADAASTHKTTDKSPLAKRNLFHPGKQRAADLSKSTRICSQCGKRSAVDASFCQYCGAQFSN